MDSLTLVEVEMRSACIAFLAACSLIVVVGCESGTSIKALEPNFGNVSGNDDVVILGSGFEPGMSVQFGKRQVKSVVIDSARRIRVKTPAGVEGKVDVIVIREDGKTFVLRRGFSYRSEAG